VEQTDDHGRRGGRNHPQAPEIPATETPRRRRRGPQNGLHGLVPVEVRANSVRPRPTPRYGTRPYGVTFDTLDNPGWSLRIDLADTPLSDRDYERMEMHRTEDDWVVSWREDQRWCAACGPLTLGEAVAAFLEWARS
jgi:Immunity protein 53